MSDVTLYGLPLSTYVRTAMMVLAAKKVPYTFQPVDFRTDEYKQMHPFSKMPTLRHNEFLLYEVLAIGSYVDDMFEGLQLQPSDPVAKAKMFQWISITNDYLYETLVRRCIHERVVKPMRGMDPNEQIISDAQPQMAHHMDVVEAALSNAPYFAGEKLSLADLFVAPILAYFEITPEGEHILADLPATKAWLDRMRNTDNFHVINQIVVKK